MTDNNLTATDSTSIVEVVPLPRKVILCGNQYVGKTKVMCQLLNLEPRDDNGEVIPHNGAYLPTHAVEKRIYTHSDGVSQDEIWEVGGKLLFRGIEAPYYKDAKIAIVYTELAHKRPIVRYNDEDRSVSGWRREVRRVQPDCLVIQANSLAQLRWILETPEEELRAMYSC